MIDAEGSLQSTMEDSLLSEDETTEVNDPYPILVCISPLISTNLSVFTFILRTSMMGMRHILRYMTVITRMGMT